MLEKEIGYYQKNIDIWLKESPGKYVVIKDETLVGIFDTNEEALSEAALHFGLSPCLIRRIEKTPEEIRLPAFTLGLLHANPSHTTFRRRPNS
jgi:hypothetical protein